MYCRGDDKSDRADHGHRKGRRVDVRAANVSIFSNSQVLQTAHLIFVISISVALGTMGAPICPVIMGGNMVTIAAADATDGVMNTGDGVENEPGGIGN
jgi:hypothetical protein